jgi:hypothetical protein
MTSREWIDAVRAQGLTVELNSGRSRSTMPVLVYREDGKPLPDGMRRYSAALAVVGIDAVAEELRREKQQ